MFNGLYLAAIVVMVFVTRATSRRVVGALVAGAATGILIIGVVALGERMGWWRMAITWKPYFLTLLELDCMISCAAVYLVTWRVERRFGWRGIMVIAVILAFLGPVRDYQ